MVADRLSNRDAKLAHGQGPHAAIRTHKLLSVRRGLPFSVSCTVLRGTNAVIAEAQRRHGHGKSPNRGATGGFASAWLLGPRCTAFFDDDVEQSARSDPGRIPPARR